MDQVTNPAEARAGLLPEIVAETAAIQEFRRDIHAHPELCFEELRTAERVAEALQAWGICVHRGLGKTGVVGTIKAGSSPSAIGLRADMDALPILEQNGFAHASVYPGKMHACGHDGHTAMLLAAARYLARHKNFDGTVHLIFQPAEEGGGGADAMIKDGLFERFPMRAVYGMHNWPGIPVGQFAVGEGPVMAAFDTFRVVIRGKGCHAALPHLGLDPVPVSAQIITAFQTILTRSANPLDSGVLSVTTVHVGEAKNVIADSCEMTGTLRTFSADLMNLIQQRMTDIVKHTCLAHGMTGDIEFTEGYPATVNDPQQAELCRRVMAGIVGKENVLRQQPVMGAEDFAYMLQQLPGCYCFIGNGQGEHRLPAHGLGPCTLHNASYDFNDEILPLGATYWVKLVESCLAVAE
ncbi:M20 family metallopeptidase [Methylomonas sp. SURF-2]|uniref:M20 family metallopeptidase n=1 Tax=Methylomonas subterranea TaxID=2952225 RepID=A0ABT1TIJ9_9GAMM|nr:M20 aminoacylase family protein [Methylomonas sp. SURF-2]MCQ8105297.1 M20 family metallopeptidase [Methylomonas sp. SURF-2]